MRDVRIRPEQLADTIKKELDDLAEDTTDTVKKAVQAAANTAVKDLKATSPKRTGKYAKSWTQKKVKDNSSGKEIIVHAWKYQLTHEKVYMPVAKDASSGAKASGSTSWSDGK